MKTFAELSCTAKWRGGRCDRGSDVGTLCWAHYKQKDRGTPFRKPQQRLGRGVVAERVEVGFGKTALRELRRRARATSSGVPMVVRDVVLAALGLPGQEQPASLIAPCDEQLLADVTHMAKERGISLADMVLHAVRCLLVARSGQSELRGTL